MAITLGLPFADLIWCGIVLFVAAFVRGYSGFGFTAILMAGLTFVLPVAEIVPLSIALEVFASMGQARGIAAAINWRRLGILVIAGLIGTPIGVYLLGELPDEPLRVSILVFIFVGSLVLIFLPQRPLKLSHLNFALAGFVAGVVNGATALSGLTLALFFTMTSEKAATIRATMIAYLLVTDVWTGGLLIGSGLYDGLAVTRVFAALPLLGLGVWTGSKQFGSAHPDSFRTNILWLLLALSAIGFLLIGLT